MPLYKLNNYLYRNQAVNMKGHWVNIDILLIYYDIIIDIPSFYTWNLKSLAINVKVSIAAPSVLFDQHFQIVS